MDADDLLSDYDFDYSKAKPNRFAMIKAPWTPEQVAALNAYQNRHAMHPYTCGGNRMDEKHLDGEGVLVATEQGWMCPYCDYRQDWALEATLTMSRWR